MNNKFRALIVAIAVMSIPALVRAQTGLRRFTGGSDPGAGADRFRRRSDCPARSPF